MTYSMRVLYKGNFLSNINMNLYTASIYCVYVPQETQSWKEMQETKYLLFVFLYRFLN